MSHATLLPLPLSGAVNIPKSVTCMIRTLSRLGLSAAMCNKKLFLIFEFRKKEEKVYIDLCIHELTLNHFHTSLKYHYAYIK